MDEIIDLSESLIFIVVKMKRLMGKRRQKVLPSTLAVSKI